MNMNNSTSDQGQAGAGKGHEKDTKRTSRKWRVALFILFVVIIGYIYLGIVEKPFGRLVARDWMASIILGVLICGYMLHIHFIQVFLKHYWNDFKEAYVDKKSKEKEYYILTHVYLVSAIMLPVFLTLQPEMVAIAGEEYPGYKFSAGAVALYRAVIVVLITVILALILFAKEDVIRAALIGAFIIDFVAYIVLSTILNIDDGLKEFKLLPIWLMLPAILFSLASSAMAITTAFCERMTAIAKAENPEVNA